MSEMGSHLVDARGGFLANLAIIRQGKFQILIHSTKLSKYTAAVKVSQIIKQESEENEIFL